MCAVSEVVVEGLTDLGCGPFDCRVCGFIFRGLKCGEDTSCGCCCSSPGHHA